MDWEEELSSIFVTTPEDKYYGTRSQVVLLVDKNNKVELKCTVILAHTLQVTFIERSKIVDSLTKGAGPSSLEVINGSHWHITKYEFQLTGDSKSGTFCELE